MADLASMHLRHANHPNDGTPGAPWQRQLELTIVTRAHRFRLMATYGTPPGSHIGLWRTRSGDVSGWNLRIGRRYRGPCLTFLAHHNPIRANRG